MKRYILVPVLLSAYALFMTLYFGIDLLKSGHTLRFFLTLFAEIILIVLSYFALRKRDRLRNNRKN